MKVHLAFPPQRLFFVGLFLSALALFLLFPACKSTPKQRPDDQPRKIEILFLGHDSEHHPSAQYAPMLMDALSRKGINITYTQNPDDLNAENLDWYDGLMVYANHDSITPSQEKALLDFVNEGKGFIPVHCASWCFRNSDEYVALVGGQFKSHDTAVFTAEIINGEHPVTQGLQPFETWDETYIHDKHNSDRTVLMERVEGDHREPWTWVRNVGKGRVFYTAYGHDERTWGNPGFHQLMQQGILWAVGERVNALWAQLSFPEHKYEPRPTIANYEKRPQQPLYQLPFKQPESEKFIQVPPQFDLEIFAAEPDIINPIAMAWDEKGRLWVIETVDYPNEVIENEPGDDRIKICEDTDGDGKADKFTVFADGLNIPTSLVFVNGGVVISQAPDFLFLKDTDGDDKADVKEKIISGWGVFDTHAGPSNLKYGFDNQIWGTVGYSGFEGQIAGKAYKFRQGFYHFTPDVTSFEFMTSTSNNTWGLGFSETFDVFGSTANNAHSWYMGIPNRYFEGIEGIESKGSRKIAAYYPFHPITRNIRQVDVFGGFTAAAGHNLYTARAFPREYWNRIALICEPTGRLLAQGILEKDGAGFKTLDGWNLLASSDEWVAPVHAEVGPDGAVWVLDWYNFIIQHNPTPNPERGGYQAENGKGNAHENPLRDKQHGRIYRIVYKNAPEYKPLVLSKDNPKQLVRALGNDNLFWRMTAQRLLVERGNQDILSDLYKLAKNAEVDEIGLNGAAVHALWTMHGLGALSGNNDEANKVVIAALSHPAAGVRKAAAQVLPHTWWARNELMKAGLITDGDLHTRLAAFLALADMPAAEETGRALYAAISDTINLSDPWLSQALYIAAHTHQDGFMEASKDQPVPPLVETFRQNHSGPKTEINPEGDFSGKKISLKTIANQMKYDLKAFTVNAGEMVEIAFENTDLLQHNLLILAPGSLEKVGAEADKLAQDPKGMEQGYTPKMKEVLHASGLTDPKEVVRIRFKAPVNPGDYPFVCTFPGHWRMMNGIMKVVPVQ
ncbi:MAG: ThuA domain-containing protein [Bacteroidia bacterium]|nr:ThuA domain-containing protein [Bacteroidia bacterium]